MKRQWLTFTTVALSVLVAGSVLAQQPNSPHIGFAYPAGGQQGTTFKVKLGGRFLTGASGVLVSGRGVTADVSEFDPLVAGQKLTDMRDKAQALQQELQKKGNDPALRQELQDLRLKIGNYVRRQQNPVIAEILTVEVKIAGGAEPGLRQLRVNTPTGLSNPILFAVGQLPEVMEKDLKSGPADAEQPITIPAVVNGRIIPGDGDRVRTPVRQGQQYAPGDVDRYRFRANQGQDLVLAVSARELMPYLADAVPGWFQATLTLFDAEGHELAYDDDYRFQPDPVLRYTIPRDGEYVAEIKDALFRGREDFVYRLTIGAVPFITSVFPLGGTAGTRTNTELTGWNLPTTRLTVDAKGNQPGLFPISLRTGTINSNRVPFALDALPEVMEREPNNSVKEAQTLALPVIVNGRIQQAGDEDVFRLDGKAGMQVAIEVAARRLGSPLDSRIELTDATGKRIAFNDDSEDKSAGLLTHQADSYVLATLPAAGTYYVRLGDTQRQGGAEFSYRLRVSPARQDFTLLVSPSTIIVPGGGNAVVTATIVRHDGFAGDVVLGLKDAPGGFIVNGGVVPAGQDKVRLTVTAPPGAARGPVDYELEGRATIGGKPVTHRAVPTEDMMQAFAYRHLVATDGLRASIIARGQTRVQSALQTAQPIRIAVGGSAPVRVTIPPGYRTFEKVELELSEPPDGISVRDLSLGFDGATFVIVADRDKAKAGVKGNLIVNVSGVRMPLPNAPNANAAARQRQTIGTLPAIPIEITPREQR